ncbi:MAG: hypothetical protein JWN03_8452 [Nocardia sp.]|nr:hypothetical protein [Nocardia sp.]
MGAASVLGILADLFRVGTPYLEMLDMIYREPVATHLENLETGSR